VARRIHELGEVLEGSGWRAVGEPLTMFYDPLWTIPFLRRNDVAVPVIQG
jgi:hypothetical protein